MIGVLVPIEALAPAYRVPFTLAPHLTLQPAHLVELQFAQSLPSNHRVSHAAAMTAGPTLGPWSAGAAADGGEPGASAGWQQLQQQFGEELHVLQAHDRLLVIAESLQAAGSSGAAGEGWAGRMRGG